MRKIYAVLAGVGLVLLFNTKATETSSEQPDSIVQVAAESQGLELISYGDLPPFGTYWEVTTNTTMAPLPFPPSGSTFPIYTIADGIFLVDATGGQVSVRGQTNTVADALAAQSNSVVTLIGKIQSSVARRQIRSMGMMSMDVPMPGDGDGGGDSEDTNYYSSPIIIDTNLLWLEITNVSNGWSYYNLHNATNRVYAITTTTNLLMPFAVEWELWPIDTNCQSFSLQNIGRPNLFVRAMDWTGVTHGGNTVPDWWLWEYFGTTSLLDTNLDSQGNTLVYDYTNGFDPNIINFSVVAESFVNTATPQVELDITGGSPNYYVISVDDTNYETSAYWLPYAGTNLTVNLGFTEGWHDVWIGLKGHAPDATVTWQYQHMKLDFTPPSLILTNFVSGSVISKPMIQLYGFSPEPLSALTYDVVNTNGSFTNQIGFTVNQFYDRTALDLTTNWFECLDIALAHGTNYLTLHAADRAGNVALTNLVCVFSTNGDATPPAITLTWPQPNMKLSGTNFTLRGTLDDETAVVSVRVVNNSGTTNLAGGLVERDGIFWAENLPLSLGTNTVTVNAIDVAGNSSQTNFIVTGSDFILTIDAVSDSQLNGLVTSVTGTVSDPSYVVWVNGVVATSMDEYGNWQADGVPISSSGTASFSTTAYPAGEAPSSFSASAVNPQTAGSVDTGMDESKPPYVYVQHYDLPEYHSKIGQYNFFRFYPIEEDLSIGWTKAGGGDSHYIYTSGIGFNTNTLPGFWDVSWPKDAWTPTLDGTKTGAGLSYNGTNSIGAPTIPMEQCDIKGTGYFYNDADSQTQSAQYKRKASTIVRLSTGGKKIPGEYYLHALSVSLYQRAFNWWFGGGSSDDINNIAPKSTAGVFGTVGNDNMAYQQLAGGQDVVITPIRDKVKHQGGGLPSDSMLQLKLKSVTFKGDGYHDIIREGVDTNTFQSGLAYPTPHWFTNEDTGIIQSSPALYVCGNRVQTTTSFIVTNFGTFPVVVKGVASGGLTSFTLWGTNTPGGRYWAIDTVADKPLTTNKIDFFKPMTINWSYAAFTTNPPLKFVDAGISTNLVYVSLREPAVETLGHTMVQIACANAVGLSNSNEIVQAIWDNFPGLTVKRATDGAILHYWNTEDPQGGGDSYSLALYADGTCGSWANMFLDAQKVHGITGATNWWIAPPSGFQQIGIYTSLPAQGNPHPPSKFIDHNVVEWNGVIYDPSYGKTFSSKVDWEDSSVSSYFRSDDSNTNDAKGVLETIWSQH